MELENAILLFPVRTSQTSVPSSMAVSGFLGGSGGLTAGRGLAPVGCGWVGGLATSPWWAAAVGAATAAGCCRLATGSELSVDLTYITEQSTHHVLLNFHTSKCAAATIGLLPPPPLGYYYDHDEVTHYCTRRRLDLKITLILETEHKITQRKGLTAQQTYSK